MDISNLLIRVIFLLLPGIITSLLYQKLRGKTSQREFDNILEIVVFSVFSYGLYGASSWILGKAGLVEATFTSFNAFSDEKVPLPWHEIIAASSIGVLFAFMASYFYTHRVLNRIGRYTETTKRLGDEDVWDYFHTHLNTDYGWVFVRDHKLDLIYYGWISAYSDSEKERELLLRDVQVYSNTVRGLLYEVSAIYFSRNRYDLTIEVPKIENEDSEVNDAQAEVGKKNDKIKAEEKGRESERKVQ